MLVGILYEPYHRFTPILEKYEQILNYNGIDCIRLDLNDLDFWDTIPKLDLFIFRGRVREDQQQRMEAILPVIQNHYGVSCFPNLATYWPYDNKIKEYYLLKSRNFPITTSWIFWDRQKALEWLKTAPLPLIFKLKSGAASNNVILVKTKRKAIRLTKKMFSRGISYSRIPSFNRVSIKKFKPVKRIRKLGGNILRYFRHEDSRIFWSRQKNYVFFQKFLPGNNYDTRVVTFGNRAFAFRRMNRKNDFRSSGSGIFDHDPTKIDLRFIKTALEISAEFKFQSMAYDFLLNENKEPEFCEISYIFTEDKLGPCPGYWDIDLNWHEGHFCTQHLHLMDCLKKPDLKMPPI